MDTETIIETDTPSPGPTPPPRSSGGLMAALRQAATGETAPEPVAKETTTPAAPVPEPVLAKPPAVVAPTPDAPLKKGLDALDDVAPAKTETPAAAETDDTPPDAKTPEAKNAWSTIKKEAATLRAEKLAWEAEKTKLAADLESARKISDSDPVKKEAEALRKRVEELEPVVARTEYRKSALYMESVTQPMNQIGDDASALAKHYEISEDKVLDALRESDPKRQNEMLDELADTMTGRDKSRLYDMANRLEGLYRLDDKLSANASKALAEVQANEVQQAEKSKNERRAAEMRAVVDSRPQLLKAAAYFKMPGESDEAAADAVIADANAVPFDEQEVKGKAFAMNAASLVPRMLRAFQTQKATDAARIAELEGEIASLAGASPRAGDGTAVTTAADAAPGGLMGALRAKMAQVGAGN